MWKDDDILVLSHCDLVAGNAQLIWANANNIVILCEVLNYGSLLLKVKLVAQPETSKASIGIIVISIS